MGYLTLFQTLEKLKGIPEPYQPQALAQLAEACINDKITPVFLYSLYALEYVSGTGDSAEYIIIPVRGYLTHENLVNVFNWTSPMEKRVEFTEATIYELTQKEPALYSKKIALAKTTFHHLRPRGNVKLMRFDVNLTGQTLLYSSAYEKEADRIRNLGGIEISQNDLLFPKAQVQEYVDSFISDSAISSSFFMRTPTVSQTEPRSDKEVIELLRQEIADLESQLAQAKAELADLPADDKELAPNSQAGVARMLYAILIENGYDLLPTKGKGVANDMIVNAANNHGTPVTRNFVAGWLIRAREAKINNIK